MGGEGNILPTRLICACCLSTKLTFIKLDNCKHVLAFAKMFEKKVDFTSMFLCYLCHTMISKIDNFKCQFEEYSVTINEKCYDLKRRPHILGYSKIEINSVVDNGPIEHEVIEHTILNVDIKPEIKTEIVTESANESEIEAQIASDIIMDTEIKTEIDTETINELEIEPQIASPFIMETAIKTEMVTETPNESDIEVQNSPAVNMDTDTAVDIAMEVTIKIESETFDETMLWPHDNCTNVAADAPLEKTNKVKEKKKVTSGNSQCKRKKVAKLSREETMEEGKKVSASPIKLSFKCEECLTGFKNKLSLTLHNEQKHGLKHRGNSCRVCKSVFNTESMFKKHKLRHVRRIKNERQRRYRERNREKLKQREAERRKRIQYLRSTTGQSTSNMMEINNKTDASQSSSGVEGKQTASVERNEQYKKEKQRERQRRYREQNREKLKQREAERRRRLQNSGMTKEATSSNTEFVKLRNHCMCHTQN